MATKLGSAIKKVTSAVKKVVSSVAKKVSGTTQAASAASSKVLKATAIPGKIEASNAAAIAKGKAEATAATAALKPKSTISYNSQTIPLLSTNGAINPDIAGGGKNYKVSSSPTTTTYNPYFDQANFATQLNSIASGFSGGTAPTNAQNLSLGTAPVNIPEAPYQTPDISQQKADLEASKQYTDLQYKDQKAQEQSQQDILLKQNQSIMDKILGNQPQIEDVRQNYEDYYKISAQQAKVASLTNDYNALVAQRDEQIAQESSRFGLQDFTNNRINQIYNNSVARINEMSANIKFETALLTQKQELVQQAVNDFYKDEERKINLFQMYMDNNSDIISRLDKKEQDAIDKAFELKKMDIQEAKDIRMMVAKTAFENLTAGIDPWNDTPEQAIEKASKVVGVGGGLTPGQINQTVNSIAGNLDNEQITKDFNAATSQYQLMKTLGVKGKNPGDDIAFVYAFAKLMDPNSVVREGEYATIQKYAQPWLTKKELEGIRTVKNVNFLSADAKQKLLNTSTAKMKVLGAQYQNLASEYQRQIDDVLSGQPRQITNYAQAFEQPTAQDQTKADIFDSVVSQDSGGYFKNLWNSIIGK